MTKEPSDPGMALVTVTGEEASTIEGAAHQLGVEPADLDGTFGVVPIDPQRNLYAVQVRADRLSPDFVRFSNPEIEPFGKK